MSSRSEHRKLRFGIVGCGNIGPTHAAALRQLSDDTELVACADVVADRARALAQKFEISRVYNSDQELIADPEIDVVCLCTPSGMHADGAVAAMNAGKHVIAEKPMEVSLAACDRMIATSDRTGKKCTIISQHRFDASSQYVKDLVSSGKLGKIILADMSVKWWRTQAYYDSGDWRGTWKLDGGGALMNQGVHTVDVLQWLAGDVATVTGHIRTAAHERIEVEDIAVAALTFKNGAVGTLTATTAAYSGFPVRIDLYGTEGSAVIEGDHLKQVSLKNGQTIAGESASAHAVSVASGGTASVKNEAASRAANAKQGSTWGDAHRAQFTDFLRAIRTNSDPAITLRSAKKPVEVILAVYESSRTGKTVTLS